MENKRYDAIEPLVAKGNISYLSDIFIHVPKTVLANDIGKKVERFTELMNNMESFKLGDLYKIARLCKISKDQVCHLVNNEHTINNINSFDDEIS